MRTEIWVFKKITRGEIPGPPLTEWEWENDMRSPEFYAISLIGGLVSTIDPRHNNRKTTGMGQWSRGPGPSDFVNGTALKITLVRLSNYDKNK